MTGAGAGAAVYTGLPSLEQRDLLAEYNARASARAHGDVWTPLHHGRRNYDLSVQRDLNEEWIINEVAHAAVAARPCPPLDSPTAVDLVLHAAAQNSPADIAAFAGCISAAVLPDVVRRCYAVAAEPPTVAAILTERSTDTCREVFKQLVEGALAAANGQGEDPGLVPWLCSLMLAAAHGDTCLREMNAAVCARSCTLSVLPGWVLQRLDPDFAVDALVRTGRAVLRQPISDSGSVDIPTWWAGAFTREDVQQTVVKRVAVAMSSVDAARLVVGVSTQSEEDPYARASSPLKGHAHGWARACRDVQTTDVHVLVIAADAAGAMGACTAGIPAAVVPRALQDRARAEGFTVPLLQSTLADGCGDGADSHDGLLRLHVAAAGAPPRAVLDTILCFVWRGHGHNGSPAGAPAPQLPGGCVDAVPAAHRAAWAARALLAYRFRGDLPAARLTRLLWEGVVSLACGRVPGAVLPPCYHFLAEAASLGLVDLALLFEIAAAHAAGAPCAGTCAAAAAAGLLPTPLVLHAAASPVPCYTPTPYTHPEVFTAVGAQSRAPRADPNYEAHCLRKQRHVPAPARCGDCGASPSLVVHGALTRALTDGVPAALDALPLDVVAAAAAGGLLAAVREQLDAPIEN